MESAEDTLLPYILDFLSRTPDFSAKVEDIEKAVRVAVRNGSIQLRGTFKEHFDKSMAIAADLLGLLMVTDQKAKKSAPKSKVKRRKVQRNAANTKPKIMLRKPVRKSPRNNNAQTSRKLRNRL